MLVDDNVAARCPHYVSTILPSTAEIREVLQPYEHGHAWDPDFSPPSSGARVI